MTQKTCSTQDRSWVLSTVTMGDSWVRTGHLSHTITTQTHYSYQNFYLIISSLQLWSQYKANSWSIKQFLKSVELPIQSVSNCWQMVIRNVPTGYNWKVRDIHGGRGNHGNATKNIWCFFQSFLLNVIVHFVQGFSESTKLYFT